VHALAHGWGAVSTTTHTPLGGDMFGFFTMPVFSGVLSKVLAFDWCC
jgi:hypothetical protein